MAADFDISVESVRRWMRQADIDDSVKDGLTTAERADVVPLRRENLVRFHGRIGLYRHLLGLC